MGDIVNLRKARKAKARAQVSEQAATNRARSGQTKGERIATETEQRALQQRLDAARIERD